MLRKVRFVRKEAQIQLPLSEVISEAGLELQAEEGNSGTGVFFTLSVTPEEFNILFCCV